MKPHQRIFFTQFAVAVCLAALLARLPDIQIDFGLSEGQLGLLLLCLSAGVLSGLTFSVPVIERLGARTSAYLSVFGTSILLAFVPSMPSASLAAVLLFGSGLFLGMFEVNSNIETDRHEAVLGYRIMSRAHGLWSVGFFLSALAAAGFRHFAVSVELHMAIVVLSILSVAAVIFSRIENAPLRAYSQVGIQPLIALPTLAMLPLCLIGAAPLFAEGASVDWSAIYMRDVFAVAPFTGGLAPAIFSFSIAAGRLLMDPVVDRYNSQNVAVTLLAVTAAGLVIVATAAHEYVALAGFGLIGIGCSSVYPLAISAAAQRTDRPGAINVAALSQTTFVVFFLGPPLLGFAAEHFGVRTSYWLVVPVVLSAMLVTKTLSR
ncbi:MAG: MFS transporter [Hoeflea sp.]|uniref:MFS transporter n=1 Tax=Hoeflea sp. TaxID=1940281 RepID=UPI00272F7F1F|nr:MFS transporter [Hoeflea sp.]MDP2120193.1 MFS transporter [Hoeflea sp.]